MATKMLNLRKILKNQLPKSYKGDKAEILQNLMSCHLPNIYFLSKPLNLIGCHGNQKAEFAKNIQLNSEAIYMGDKAETLQKCS